MNVQYKNKKYQTENNNNKNIPIDEKKNCLNLNQEDTQWKSLERG